MSDRPTIVDLHIAGVDAARVVRSDEHSVLYRAPHRTRGHDVDVEILPGSQGEAARARFAREQQALGRLAGVEGVVPLLEAGVTIDGDLYLMTPTLGGRSLAEIIATDGPMAWPDATRIIEAAATTLHHAHVVGVTHRRIDPDTIVVTGDGRVLITGLGSAGLTMDASGSPLPTVDHPGYRPPEWSRPAARRGVDGTDAGGGAVGDSADAGPAGDIYGLGATLWALLAGRRPFTRADATGDTGADDAATIARRAATTRVGDLRSVAPASVAEAVEWATTVEPERRPSSAATFARALREATSRAPSGFIADPDAVVAGWQPVRDPEDSGRPRDADEATGGDATGDSARASLAAAMAAAGFDDVAPSTVPGTDGGSAAAESVPGTGETPLDHRSTVRAAAPATAVAAHRPMESSNDADGDGTERLDDGRRAGLLVGLGIAAIALVALAASAVLVAFVGEDGPVTISGPSIAPGDDEVPAEVLGVEIEADADDGVTAGSGSGATDSEAPDDAPDDAASEADGDEDTGADGPPGDGTDGSAGHSAAIEPFAIPTPTPETTVGPAAAAENTSVAGSSQPPAERGPTATPTPGTTISAPPPPSLSPRPTPTPETVISAPPAPPPAPTTSPTPMPTIAPAPTPTPVPPTPSASPVTPTETPVPPTPTPETTADPLGIVDTPN